MITAISLFLASTLAHSHGHFYEKTGAADATDLASASFFVRLPEGAADDCDSTLNDIADPKSTRYGKWLSFEEVGSRFGGDVAHLKPVLMALHEAGFGEDEVFVTPNREIVSVSGHVAKFEQLLAEEGVRFHSFALKEDPTVVKVMPETAFTSRHLSSTGLGAHIDGVSGLALPEPASLRAPFISAVDAETGAKRQQPSPKSTPSLLQQYYGVSPSTVASQDATQAIFASLSQSFDPTDLSTFQSQFSTPNNPIQVTVGTNDPSACASNPDTCTEASLDVQQITSNGANTTFWSVQASDDLFVDWITAVAALPNPPLVHSVSYGSSAKEDPKNDMTRFNTEVCKITARGITVLVSSGDDGAAGSDARQDPSTACASTDPSYPATSPYVTAVGATQGPESGSTEVVCQSDNGAVITSGGGFSNVFSTPQWQSSAVSAYLSALSGMSGAIPSSYYNPQGRMYPDVAMEGTSFPVVVGGQTYNVAGTSASSPYFASLVTLVNGQRLAAGKTPVGFLNPFIYQNAGDSSIFNDVTSGVNRCSAGPSPNYNCCPYGFNATQGADAASGVGSVHFAGFAAALMNI
uniref:Peptidase S53 domain-containing protein n=1 Tax=Sexangularia sp. CB-2014 TaxID=1486929 RepID=A0A7S1VBJ7_9EUKA|mmetsp:Transcript_15578/g.48761  ORF Transcript_15578/g.48761 Transcript_15578/m.48761 type:complete len:579 (+) Transcript_15578:50-1786(+)